MNGKKKNKRELNKKILSRLIFIIKIIKAGKFPTNKKLCDLYIEETGDSVSSATMSRDIDTLRTYFGAPLEFDREKNGYYFSDENWHFAISEISPEEIFYLSVAKSLLSNLSGTPIYNVICDAIDFLSAAQTSNKKDFSSRIILPPKPQFKIDSIIWKKILSALRENRIVEFDYRNCGKIEKLRRRVRPYQIVFDDGQCFLYGFAEEKGAMRLFSLSRIENVVKTSAHFDLPEDFDFSTKCGGGKFGAFSVEKTENYTVDFYDESRDFVKGRIWADDQKIEDFDEDERTRISFSSRQSEKILEWVLSQGATAIPVSPPALVESWKAQIAMMSKNVDLAQ